jgi:hypothetical protein
MRCPTCSQVPQLLPPGRHWLYHSCRRWQVEPGGQDWPGKRLSAQEEYCAQLPPLPPHWSHSRRVEPEPWMHCQYHSPARPRAGGVASGPEWGGAGDPLTRRCVAGRRKPPCGLLHSLCLEQVEPPGQDWPVKGPSTQPKLLQLPPLPPHWSQTCAHRTPVGSHPTGSRRAVAGTPASTAPHAPSGRRRRRRRFRAGTGCTTGSGARRLHLQVGPGRARRAPAWRGLAWPATRAWEHAQAGHPPLGQPKLA